MTEKVIPKVLITEEAQSDYEDIIGGIMPKSEIKRETEEYISNCISRFNGYYFKAKYQGEDSDIMLLMFFYKGERFGNMQMWELRGICLEEDWDEISEECGQIRFWLNTRLNLTDGTDWVWDLRLWQAEQKKLLDEEYGADGEKTMETVKKLLENYKLNKAKVAVGNKPETEQLKSDMDFLDKCIEQLDDEAKAIVTSLYVDGMSLAKVGRRFGYCKTAVFKKRNRALKMLELLYCEKS